MSSSPRAQLPPVLHRKSLLDRGFTDADIRTARQDGSWQRVHRGVYCATEPLAQLAAEQRHRLRAFAVAERSPHLVLSHVSAAIAWGLPIWQIPLDRVHLTRNAPSGGRVGPGRVVHSSVLTPDDVVTVDGVTMTSVARTLVDLGCSESMESTVIAADAALRELVAPAELATTLSRAHRRRGASVARRALHFADGRSESPGESRLRVIQHRVGLPAPVLQVRVYTPGGALIGRADQGYPELGLLMEFDGLVKYRAPLDPGRRPEEVVIAEKRREDNLRALGFLVARFTWNDLRDEAGLAARVRRDMERGRLIAASGALIGRWEAAPPLQIALPGS